jgi:solute carrier family 8 (sodium/calcium exchanger)
MTNATANKAICGGAVSQVLGGSDGGLFFPLGGEWEGNWPAGLKVFLYLLGLLYCFDGVAIIADIFMGAIEKVTSRKKQKKIAQPNGEIQEVTVAVWNETFANLTLMALGSSAPEILLNVISLFQQGMHSEALGPGTIVGSAAFNLLCIVAVCVACLPAGQVRYIQQTGVFAVTASFSIFAYLWLIFILNIVTPDVVTVWEGVLTFLFFPVLAFLAYVADIGYFNKLIKSGVSKSEKLVLSGNSTEEEKIEMKRRIREKYGDPAEEHMEDLMKYEFSAPLSRGKHRVNAIRCMTGGKQVLGKQVQVDDIKECLRSSTLAKDNSKDDNASPGPADGEGVTISFSKSHEVVLESKEQVKLLVKRSGDLQRPVTVNYATRDGSAKESQDYDKTSGTLEFKAGEKEKSITIKIVDDNQPESTEEFYVDIFEPKKCWLGDFRSITVVIIDSDRPGKLAFARPSITVLQTDRDKKVEVLVKRSAGAAGVVGCSYETEDDTALAGKDYDATSGQLVFADGQMQKSFSLKIKAAGKDECGKEVFRVNLKDPTGDVKFDENTDGGADKCILTVTIEADKKATSTKGRALHLLGINTDQAEIGSSNYAKQFKEALYAGGSREAQKECSWMDCALHIVSMPWKLLFAVVPPTDFAGGWICFCVALLMIGLVTCFIGDLANLLGCALDIKQGIVAITFVALGTSLPDTFASKTAAERDQYADNCIGNVTGSNSVNVFLGLGLPWTIGAIYWSMTSVNLDDPNDSWTSRAIEMGWPQSIVSDYPGQTGKGAFVVIAGELGTSVMVFTCCAVLCIVILILRRILVGGELGGPKWSAYLSAAIFVGLWIIYIAVACKDGVSPFCESCDPY